LTWEVGQSSIEVFLAFLLLLVIIG